MLVRYADVIIRGDLVCRTSICSKGTRQGGILTAISHCISPENNALKTSVAGYCLSEGTEKQVPI